MIKIKNYPISNNIVLSHEILSNYITNFWNDVFINIKDTSHIMVMCKVQFTEYEMGYKTLGHLRRVNYSDKELFIEYLSQRLSILNDSYVSVPILNFTFSYLIQEGLFLGLKKYGYWYLDDDGNKVESSVFAGVKRNSLSFNEIIVLYQGFKLHKSVDSRFYKSFNNLNISIKSANISIQKSDSKLLVDNNYLPFSTKN
jgi:hypothetical protein